MEKKNNNLQHEIALRHTDYKSYLNDQSKTANKWVRDTLRNPDAHILDMLCVINNGIHKLCLIYD